MAFIPVALGDYVRLHLESNRDDTAAEVTKLLRSALEARLAGATCRCGEPIWVIGSAFAGRACFTCITGEAYPSDDYEIAEACDTRPRGSRDLRRQ